MGGLPSDLNNGLKNTVDKLQDTTNEFREKVSDLEYDIKLINEYDNNLIPKLLKEDEERIVELFNKDRIILGEPTDEEEEIDKELEQSYKELSKKVITKTYIDRKGKLKTKQVETDDTQEQ